MEPFTIFLIAVAVAVIGIGGGVAYAIIRRMPKVSVAPSAIERVLAVQGSARCVEALNVLRQLAAGDDFSAWERIEMPLIQALPDCPPGLKQPLVDACDACVARCANRDLAKRIMAVRNSLLITSDHGL